MDNFSYIIYCQKTKSAALVDPSFDAAKALEFITEDKLKLLYLINTHHHSDHTGDNQSVINSQSCELIISSLANPRFSFGNVRKVIDSEILSIGEANLKFIHTPGHTQDGICIIVNDEALITGDTLFIGDCGRCDLPGSNIAKMFESLQKIKSLPDHLIVYPGHDYGDKPYDTLGSQKRINKTLLAKTLGEFSKIP